MSIGAPIVLHRQLRRRAHGRRAAVGTHHELGANLAARRLSSRCARRARRRPPRSGRSPLFPSADGTPDSGARSRLGNSRSPTAASRPRTSPRAGTCDTSAMVSSVSPICARIVPDLVVRPSQKRVEQAEFVHQLHRRRVDRVAAKIAEEVGVFLQHRNVDARAREQEAEHHAGRAATRDDAAGARSLDALSVHESIRSASRRRRPAGCAKHAL